MRPLNNAETVKRREYYRKNKPRFQKQRHEYYLRNKEKELSYMKDRNEKIKNDLFAILSNECTCNDPTCWHIGKCGLPDKRILQLDHINGDGEKDRQRLGWGINLYYYYVNHPDEAKEKLQLLCANCNWMKRSGRGHEHGGEEHRFRLSSPCVRKNHTMCKKQTCPCYCHGKENEYD